MTKEEFFKEAATERLIDGDYFQMTRLISAVKDGADLNVNNAEGTSILNWVLEHLDSFSQSAGLPEIEIIQYLINHGADVNFIDAYNHSPLMVSIRFCRLNIIELLLVSGAKINTPKLKAFFTVDVKLNQLQRKVKLVKIEISKNENFGKKGKK